MSWDDTRGGVVTTTRLTGHTDDAKERTDETHETGRVPQGRSRALVPALVGAVIVVLLGGAATAAWMSARGDDPAPPASGSGTDPTADTATDAPAPTVDPTTGLPLEPTDQEITYAGVLRCVEAGPFLLSPCPSVYPETLTCPEGRCTIYFWIGPHLDGGLSDASNPEEIQVKFRAGDPTVQFQGSDKDPPCFGSVNVDGTRQSDGGYEIQIVHTTNAAEADGSCSGPTDDVFTVTLAPPP